MQNQPTLSQTMDLFRAEITKRDIVLSTDDETTLFSHYENGINYGVRVNSDCAIQTIKGKGTKKWLHLVVERLPTGYYEPIFYVL